jgi:hypothetical protein
VAVAIVAAAAPQASAKVSTLGGPVMHVERTHVIFWNPSGSGLAFDPGYQQLVTTFLRQVAHASGSAGNEFGLIGQYRGPGGPAAYDSTFAGAIDDTDPAPSGPAATCQEPPPPPASDGPGWDLCVNDAAMQSELVHVVHERGLPTGLKDVYFLVMPRGFASCFGDGPSDCALGGDANDGYCGYHADIGSARLLYAVIPYNALDGHCRSSRPRPNRSGADPTISTIAHELAETATDPLGDGWSDDSGNEIADLCLHNFGPDLGESSGPTAYNQVIDGGHYYLQDLWSNYGQRCAAEAPADRVALAAPRRAAAGRRVLLAAVASARGRTLVSYAWSLGDRRILRRSSTLVHVWARPGRYTVTVTATDSWGDRTTATHAIRIATAA